MSTAALKRELALLRSSLAALTPSQSAALDDPIAWAERIAGLSLDPWQRDVLDSHAQGLLLCCSRQAGKSSVAAGLALLTAFVEAPALVLLLSPTLRQSGELFRDKLLPLYRGLGRPVANRGGRFSRNDPTPSTASALAPSAISACDSARWESHGEGTPSIDHSSCRATATATPHAGSSSTSRGATCVLPSGGSTRTAARLSPCSCWPILPCRTTKRASGSAARSGRSDRPAGDACKR